MIPNIFCWTKMGAESGQGLQAIIRRKEWERCLGDGLFFWGIGHSLGSNARAAAVMLQELKVVFSPMLSKAKTIDSDPGEVVAWNSWVDHMGYQHTLPLHSLVTSRALLPSGRLKSNHYALVCRSELELAHHSDVLVYADHLRNLQSGKPLGDSQVTAVVSQDVPEHEHLSSRSYPVSFIATLAAPYYVQLAQPFSLSRFDVDAISDVTQNGSIGDWEDTVRGIRARFRSANATDQVDLFADRHDALAFS